MKAKISERLDPLVEIISELKRSSDEIGAILVFIGVVRGRGRDGSKVLRLEYEAHPTLANKVMRKILEEAISKHGLIGATIEHRVGEVKVGEDIMYVVVASRHRGEGFKALEELVDRIKKEVPIWKKEVTESGAYWVKE
ncbi:MAG: molybdenum cofactor biosynthesis protein MoaE [Thermoprotei archaeon]|nr:MAG: molybdenum cofactor biosynthesis protein MoaE [Thermoprotei archaeon]RLF25737.1 MAG: molybdenum cofactor biosynthesis protein MoaE [Thermoprotei archaeon]